jgi:hypothetical protein
MATRRRTPQQLLTTGMRQLSRQLRIRFHLNNHAPLDRARGSYFCLMPKPGSHATETWALEYGFWNSVRQDFFKPASDHACLCTRFCYMGCKALPKSASSLIGAAGEKRSAPRWLGRADSIPAQRRQACSPLPLAWGREWIVLVLEGVQ